MSPGTGELVHSQGPVRSTTSVPHARQRATDPETTQILLMIWKGQDGLQGVTRGVMLEGRGARLSKPVP